MVNSSLTDIIIPQEDLKKILYQYLSDGWYLFPVGRNKKPLTTHGLKDATQTQLGVNEFIEKYPGCNWAGYFPNQLIIDIDPRHNGSLEILEARIGQLPQTRIHQTSGGLHIIFKQPSGYDIRNSVNIAGLSGIDVRGNGGYIVLPPSVHECGNRYAILDSSPITDAPDTLLQICNHDNSRNKPDSIPEYILEGQRNTTLTKIAGSMRGKGLSQNVIEASLLEVNKSQCKPPLPDAELLKIARSISRYKPNEHKPNIAIEPETSDYADLTMGSNLTDTSNAEYFAKMYGNILRFDHQGGRWLIFKDHYYTEDTDGQVMRLAIKAIRSRYKDTLNITDMDDRLKAARWCINSEQRLKLEAMLSIAQNLKPIAVSGKDFDSNPMLLAVKNGIIDLTTGKIKDGKPEDKITQHSNIEYIPDAPIPERFVQFMDEIFNSDSELINWVYRALGYSLTGNTKEQIIFILYGNGANGKSILLSIMRYILGDYTYNAPFSTFELDTRASIPNDLAVLEKRRLVTSSETQESSRFNESRIKSLSGEDDITARYLHHEFFTFKPVAKLWLGVNHKPRVNDDSYGFWRRVRLIPFTQQFKGEKEDKNLLDTLKAEAPQILSLLVAACREYQKKGLSDIPKAIQQGTDDYKAESDPLLQFILDACVESPDLTVKASDLYIAYQTWANSQSLSLKDRISNTTFGRRISDRYPSKHTKLGKVYFGIGLKVTGCSRSSDGLDHQNELIPDINPRMKNNVVNPSNPSHPSL